MEKGKISALQMAMLLYPAIIATAILSVPGLTSKYADNDMWMSPIISSVIGFFCIFIAVKAHQLYEGKTIIEMSEDIIGKIPGKVISLLILLFYIDITGGMARNYSEFIVTSFLFGTPQIVIIGSMVFICAFCVYGGLEVLARAGQLLFPFLVVPLFFAVLFLAPDFQPENALPILEKGWGPPLQGAIVPAGWYAEFIIIAFLLPFVADQKKGLKYGCFSVVTVMLTLLLVNLIVLFVLGETTASKVYPLMNVVRYASLTSFFENMEAVIMAVWIAGAFVKISVFYYAIALGTAQWLNLSSYRPIVWPLGILITEFAFWGKPSLMDIGRYDIMAFPFASLTIQLFIPFLLLIIALLRKKLNKT